MCTKCIVLFLPSGKVVLYDKRISKRTKEEKKIEVQARHVTRPIGMRRQCHEWSSRKPGRMHQDNAFSLEFGPQE